MATVDQPVPDAGDETRDLGRDRLLAVASLAAAAAAVAVIGWATATRTHDFWAFALWVALMLAAIVTGVVALVRLPRRRELRPVRRLATLGVVGGVLCATLGLAVYSASRSDDCPRDQPCTIPQSGPGERPQIP